MSSFDENNEEKLNLNKIDIQNNIKFFINVADIGSIIFYGLAGLIILYGFLTMEDSIIKFVAYCILALICAFCGLFFEHSLKWKAYMLQINYEKLKKK